MNEKQSTDTLVIDTPDGTINVPVLHRVINENDDNMNAAVICTLQGREQRFEAETTEDSLIELAKSLPVGWSMKSCLSCRHGHFCPIGNADNELFCITEFEPKEIRDLWHVTEDPEERRNRSRTLFHLCDRYMPQSEDYFTYNDYYSVMKHL